MKRTEKEEMVGMLADIFGSSQVGFLADYRGLTVADVTELRRRLHESETGMRVLKNRIAKIAIKGTPFEPLAEHLTEPRAFIYGQEPVQPAKALSNYQRENAKLEILQGLLVTKTGITLLDPNQIRTLGNLPSRDELIAQLMSVLNGPLVGLVSAMNDIPGKFLRTLVAVGAQQGEG
ncbi:MAG: 50S ribosomal protein L10 [SAR324 cluster bacterium]|nr:50S ribosomal protein L10 [SAR324 cluster bacterium]